MTIKSTTHKASLPAPTADRAQPAKAAQAKAAETATPMGFKPKEAALGAFTPKAPKARPARTELPNGTAAPSLTGVPPPAAAAPSTASEALAAAAGTGPKYDYDQLGTPKNIDEAFDSLVSSASAPGEVRRHTDNVMAWNMKWDLVTKAQKTFDFSYFSIEQDAYGHAYLGALLNARLNGVQVNGITDYMANARGHGFTSTGMGADYLQELVNPVKGADGKPVPPCKIGIYDTLGTRAKSLLKDGVTYKAISSDHDKMAVADAGTPNAEGETGGRNVAGAYHQDPRDNPKSWRDDSIQLKGPATDGLVTALRRELDGPAVTMVKPDLFNLSDHSTELLGSYSLMESWTKAPPLSAQERGKLGLPPGGPELTEADKQKLRQPEAQQVLSAMLLEQGIARLRELPNVPDSIRKKELSGSELKHLTEQAAELARDVELRGSRSRYDTLGGYTQADVKILDQVGAASAAPGARYNEIAPDLLHLIKGAQKEIVIENPYVVLTEPMLQAFEEASRRGVKITIVTNSPESTDSAVTQGFFLNDWKNVEARVPSARIFVATGERKFHAKAFVIDGKVSGDTSYNADLLSGLVNGEIGAVTRSEANAQNLMGAIYDDLKDPANKFKEWTIKRDDQGQVVRDAQGQPVAIEGPEQDVSKKLQGRYKVVQLLCDALTRIPLGDPLEHPDR